MSSSEWSPEIANTVDGAWLAVERVRVGRVPPGEATPARYVTVRRAGVPALRIDVYTGGDSESFAFETLLVWQQWIVIGFGHHVHLVSHVDRSVVTTDLGAYFGCAYPTARYLLVASADRLRRFELDGRLAWTSGELAVDGVLVHDSEGEILRGEGEWDPPGGWRPFELHAESGCVVDAS